MVENREVEERKATETTPIPEERRCTHVLADGRRCRQRRWAGKRVCYQHDESTAARRKRKPKAATAAASGRNRMMTASEVHELLATMLVRVMAGDLPVGRAYAIGYLAQLMLTVQQAAAREAKLDVKHFREMVELGAAVERARELQEETEREEAEAQESEETEVEKA